MIPGAVSTSEMPSHVLVKANWILLLTWPLTSIFFFVRSKSDEILVLLNDLAILRLLFKTPYLIIARWYFLTLTWWRLTYKAKEFHDKSKSPKRSQNFTFYIFFHTYTEAFICNKSNVNVLLLPVKTWTFCTSAFAQLTHLKLFPAICSYSIDQKMNVKKVCMVFHSCIEVDCFLH